MVSFNEYFVQREDLNIQKELDQFEYEVKQLHEVKKTHPGKGISKEKKSEVVKTARKGENVFGGGFEKIAKGASKRYGSKEAGKRVAAAIMWKKVAKKGMTESTEHEQFADDLLWIIEDDVDVILDSISKRENEQTLTEKKWIQKAHLKKGRCTPAPNPDCPKGSRQYALAMRFKHGDLHK